MWPVVAIAAVSAIAQWYNSEQARNANSEELARMRRLYDQVQQPDFNTSYIDPEDFRVLQQYVPEIAVQIQEEAPTTIQETGNMMEGRDAQMNALRRLAGIASETNDPALMQQLNEAASRAQQESQSRYESQMQDAQRKGMYGSGISQALAQQQGANAMQQAGQQSQAAAAEAYRNRLRALSESATLGGNIRNQDISLQSKNADIINAFNARTATANQQWQNDRANEINAGNRFNIGQNQAAADKNTAANNQAAINQRDMYNTGQQNRFNNELRKRGFMGDLSNAQRGMNTQNAQDTNQMIQGIAGAGAAAYGAYENNARDDARWDRQQQNYNRQQDDWQQIERDRIAAEKFNASLRN